MGDPVTADDDNADDVLTYTLTGRRLLAILRYRRGPPGQISVAKDAEFNVTADNNIDGVTDMDSYTVTVIATDPKGTPTEMAEDATAVTSGTVMVAISVTAVDEPPIFSYWRDTV